jgi:putative DNA primase/helicase
MADLNDTQTADLSSEVAAMPPTLSEGKTKRARARGADTQATRTACAQPALELWQQYTPAPIDHPAIERHGVLVDDARVSPVDADMPFPDDDMDWLVLPLTNPKGEVVSLAYLHPEQNQKPRYFDGYAKGAYVPIKPQRGQVVHVVSNPQDGRMLWLAGVAAVVCFTPDDWSTPNLPKPSQPVEPYQPKGDNMAHVARAWVKAGHAVAVPVTPDRVSHYSELLSDTGAVILPIPEPLTWLEVEELAALPQQLADLWATHAPRYVSRFEHGMGRYEIRDDGLFYVDQDKEGHEFDRYLSPPVYVVAKTRTEGGTAWGRLLEWRDDDHRLHSWAMPLELLQGEATDVCKELAYRGANVSLTKRHRDLFVTYLQNCPTYRNALCVERLGWHGGVYVMPQGAIGSSSDLIVYQNPHGMSAALKQSGTLADWREQVAALAVGNSRLLFSVSLAFAAPLLQMANESSGGFHLRGTTSTGKSTAQIMACSVWGKPNSYKHTWNTTANGLEAIACMHNDGFLVLDEIKQADNKTIGTTVYMLGNEKAKSRMSKTLNARPEKTWRLLFLSSGELSLTDMVRSGGDRAYGGQEIRLADIPADTGSGYGVFERLHRTDSGAAMSRLICNESNTHYGAVGIAWLEYVTANQIEITATITPAIDQWMQQHMPKNAGGQIDRVARRFALAAIAGEMATDAGLTGWSKGEASQGAATCFNAWLESFGGIGDCEERAILEHVRAFIEAHGSSRFESMTADRERIHNRVGYIRQKAGQAREYLIFPEAFKREVCKGFDHRQVSKVLIEQGVMLHNNHSGATSPVRTPDSSALVRMYILTADGLLNSDPDTNTPFIDRNNRNNRNNEQPQDLEVLRKEKTVTVTTVTKPATVEPVTAVTESQNANRNNKNPLKSRDVTAVTAVTDKKTHDSTDTAKTANGYALNTGFAAPEPTDTNALTQGGLDL